MHDTTSAIIIGTPVHSAGAYALNSFLSNQKEIQDIYPYCKLVLAVPEYERDFIKTIEALVQLYHLKSEIIAYSVQKPSYASNRIWNIVSARNAIRSYFLNNTTAGKLLFLDSDMTFDPRIISILESNMHNNSALFSGYYLRDGRLGLAGAGCLMMDRKVMESITFRCKEYKNGQVIHEDNLLEYDLFRKGFKTKKGLFIKIKHFSSSEVFVITTPRKVRLFKRITNAPFLRFCIINLSLLFHYNIAWALFLKHNRPAK
jgi:hypothetical protein